MNFARRSWLKATPTESLTKAITYATSGSSKQLPNDVIFTWFTDKNLFPLVKMKNPDNNELDSSAATKKKHIGTVTPR